MRCLCSLTETSPDTATTTTAADSAYDEDKKSESSLATRPGLSTKAVGKGDDESGPSKKNMSSNKGDSNRDRTRIANCATESILS